MRHQSRRLKLITPRRFQGGGGGALSLLNPLNAPSPLKPFSPGSAKELVSGGGISAASGIASAPVPVPAPPISAAAAEVINAQQDVAKQNLIKKSVKKTVFAGDTGAYAHGAMSGPGGGPASYKKG